MKKLIYILIAVLVITSFCSCGKKDEEMHKAKSNPQGLAMPQEQIDKDTRGKDMINLTDEIRYPGMVSYQNAKYEFISEDSPQKVTEWFMANLKGASDNKRDVDWTVRYQNVIIDIIPYGSDGTLLRYKAKLK